MRYTFSLAAAAILVCAVPLGAQSVAGKVTDPATHRAVPEAVVTALTEAGRRVAQARTDSAGHFKLALNGAGAYRLQAQRLGYQPVTSPGFDVGMREALEVDLHMSTSAVELDPLTITSRSEPPRVRHLEAAGFYERERNGPGTFMRREDVTRNGGTLMSDVLGKLPGARKGNFQGRPVVSLGRASGGRACPPAVFVDGLPVIRAEVIDDIVHVGAIEALEVYRGPSQTPARFGGGETGCGVVVIWTQRRVN